MVGNTVRASGASFSLFIFRLGPVAQHRGGASRGGGEGGRFFLGGGRVKGKVKPFTSDFLAWSALPWCQGYQGQ